MTTAIQSMIEIPVYEAGSVVMPAFKISLDIQQCGARAIDVYSKAPTLAQLRYADSASDAIRANIRDQRYKGEFTADFVDYNVTKPRGKILPRGFLYTELVQRPDSVKQENGVWIAEGGKRIGIELPQDGYQVPDGNVRYNPETGFPVHTVNDRENAIKALTRIMPREEAEKEISYFVRWGENHEKLSPVSRRCWAAEHGPCSVRARWASPLRSSSSVGSRVVRGLAETLYGLDERKYREIVEGLETIRQGNVALGELPNLASDLLSILNDAQVRTE